MTCLTLLEVKTRRGAPMWATEQKTLLRLFRDFPHLKQPSLKRRIGHLARRRRRWGGSDPLVHPEQRDDAVVVVLRARSLAPSRATAAAAASRVSLFFVDCRLHLGRVNLSVDRVRLLTASIV